jgi:arylsulfatase A-like enzyme
MIEPGSVCGEMVLNVDFAPTFLDLAGIDVPPHIQGTSFAALLTGDAPPDWQQAMYYRYWMHQDRDHNVWAHYGVRTHRHKLICYYNEPLDQPGARGPASPPQWELFDLESDPFELMNVVDDPAYEDTVQDLRRLLDELQAACGDEPVESG